MQLRPYQEKAEQAIWHYFACGQKGNPVVAMPTGTGKSVVIARFLSNVLRQYPSEHILQLTHVKELIEQNYNKLQTLWPGAPAGIFSAGLKRKDYNAPIIFGGIGSVANRARLFQNTSLVLIDECHLVSTKADTQYRSFLDELRKFNPMLKVIGFSATPYRLGLGHITDGGLFTDVCFDNTGPADFAELIANGWLSTLIPKQTHNQLDTDDIRMQGGEFRNSDIEYQMREQDITAKALQEAAFEARDRNKWLVFASSVANAEECSQRLNMMGIPSLFVHSKMSTDQRDANIAAFTAGKVRAIVNRDILTTGFDVPDIDCIVMLRPTQSPGLWVQMLGRGTRPAPNKKNCLVLDFAGNTARLGPIDDPCLPRKRQSGGGGGAPVKTCPECRMYNHTRAPICVQCGYEFPAPIPYDETASSLALLSSQVGGADGPQIAIFKVQSMIAEKHTKAGSPDMMRVSYYCGDAGIRRFTTYVMLDHVDYALRKARQWWRQHLPDGTIPETTAEGLDIFHMARRPTHIRVWVNKKYPEVMAYDFSDTAFGAVLDRERLPEGC